MTRAVVTGLGCVTPIGQGVEDFWAALTAGQSSVALVNGFGFGGQNGVAAFRRFEANGAG